MEELRLHPVIIVTFMLKHSNLIKLDSLPLEVAELKVWISSQRGVIKA